MITFLHNKGLRGLWPLDPSARWAQILVAFPLMESWSPTYLLSDRQSQTFLLDGAVSDACDDVGENAHPLSLDSLDSLDSLASLAQCGPLPALVPDGKCCQTQNFTNLNHY